LALPAELLHGPVQRGERFGDEMGVEPVLSQVGYLFLLSDPARWAAFQAQAEMQRSLGLPVETLTAAEAQARVPVLNVEDVLGATFCGRDGLADPHIITQAYVSRARDLGARFEFARPARGLALERGRVRAVLTDAGPIETPMVVNAAGPYLGPVGRLLNWKPLYDLDQGLTGAIDWYRQYFGATA
jgi:sarcosine oxidase subunit beta